MKRKLTCVLLAVVLLGACLAGLAACNADKMKQAVKNGDNYTIVATYHPDDHTLSATQITEYTNRSDNTFVDIKLHIYANAYREGATPIVPNTYMSSAYPNGICYGDISFDSVKADGTACAYKIEGDNADILSVPLGKELFPNEKVTLEMTYKVTLPNIKHRLGYTDNAVTLGNFFPIVCRVENDNFATTSYCAVGDPFVSDVANFDVTLCAPSSYIVGASGELTSVTSKDGYDTWHYVGEARRDFALVLSDKYKKLSQNVGKTQVNYLYYADEDPQTSLATAVGMLEYMNKNVGEYPYSTYTVCETDFCYGGMEYPALVYVASGSNAYTEAIAHETAHQWFYGVVGNNQITDAWMDEGLCEFVTYLYLDSTGAVSLADAMKRTTKTYINYVDVLNRYYDNVDTSFRALTDYKNDSEYVVMTYAKGCLLFNTLYETLGETKFLRALSDYYRQCAFGIASPDKLIDCFVRCGNKELATIFDKFIAGKEIVGKMTDGKK